MSSEASLDVPPAPPEPLGGAADAVALSRREWQVLGPLQAAALSFVALLAVIEGLPARAALLALAVVGVMAWWRRAQRRSPPRRPDPAVQGVGLLWLFANLAVYPYLPAPPATAHLLLAALAGGAALVGLGAVPQGRLWLVAGCLGALPLAAALGSPHGSPHDRWPLALCAVVAGAALWWTARRQGAAHSQDAARAERALREHVALSSAHQAADARAQARSRQLTEVGHELRTPMAGMLGVLALLDRTPMPTQQRHLVSLLRTSGEGLLVLLDDVLDQARLEADRLVLRPAPTAPRALAQAAVALFEPIARARGLTLRLSTHGALPGQVLVDGQRLRQVLLNMLGNALKFTERGEVRLDLTAARLADGRVALRFAVQDSGIGIAADDLARIFEPFEQAGVAAQSPSATPGLGLGLGLCRRLVRAMGGDITVQSTPGQGSCFSFALTVSVVADALSAPVADVLAVTAAAGASAAVQGLPALRGHVLVAEGHELSRLLCAELLRGFGLTVQAVADDAAALAALREDAFDLLLIDSRLPGLDAPRLLGAWRGRQGVDMTAPVPAIALSDEPEDSPAAKAEWPALREAGLVARLVRPYLAARVHAMVSCWLPHAGPPPAERALPALDQPRSS